MVSKKSVLWLLALPCAAALLLAASATSGQSSPQTTPSSGGMMSAPMGGMMTTPMGGMMTTPGAGMGRSATGGGMMARMEESDRRLDELVSTMNSATGSAKVDAIAAVLNELVAQHRQMHQHMMSQMHEHMMSGHAGTRGGKKMMGTRGAASATPGASTTPRPRRRTTGTTSPAVSPTPMP